MTGTLWVEHTDGRKASLAVSSDNVRQVIATLVEAFKALHDQGWTWRVQPDKETDR